MLPPTIKIAPTSDMVRPNPARIAVSICAGPSPGGAGSRAAVSRRDHQRAAIMAPDILDGPWASAVTIGVRKDRLRRDHGPRSEQQAGDRRAGRNATTADRAPRPTTTGGRPRKALAKTTRTRRPGKGYTARAAPRKRPAGAARAIAEKLTPSDRPTISHSPSVSKTCQRIRRAHQFPLSRRTR